MIFEGRTLDCGCEVVLLNEQLDGYEWACKEHFWCGHRPDKPASLPWARDIWSPGLHWLTEAMRLLSTPEEAKAAKVIGGVMTVLSATPFQYQMFLAGRNTTGQLLRGLSVHHFGAPQEP